MKHYRYRALDAQGTLRQGRLSSPDLASLEQALARQGLTLLRAHPGWHFNPTGLRRPPRRELIHFCFHLEQCLRAGLPILESLQDLRDFTRHPAMVQALEQGCSAIEAGQSLSLALGAHPQCFDEVFCSLIQAGEQAGELPEVLGALHSALQREDELAGFTGRVLIYPVIVGLIVLAAVGVALTQVIPELSKLFLSTGMPLPLQTRLLVACSEFVLGAWPWLLGLGVAGVCGLILGRQHHPGLRLHTDRLLLGLPLLGDVLHKILLARFTQLFALLYRAGIPVIETLASTERSLHNRALQQALASVRADIHGGLPLAEAFARTPLFPPLLTRMLRVGEQTGALDQALTHISQFYRRDVQEATARFQAALEPLLTVVLGGLLLAVMSAVLLPIYDLATRLQF